MSENRESKFSRSRRGYRSVLLLKNSTIWYVRYSHRGKRYHKSSGSRNRMDAVRLLRQRLEELSKGSPVEPQAEKITFEEQEKWLIDDYVVNSRRSTDRQKRSNNHLREFFGLDRAIDITTDRINRYIHARLDEGAMPATVQNKVSALRRMFSLGIRANKLAHKPFIPRLQFNNARQGFFEEAEFWAHQEHLPVEIRPVTHFAYLTGWRKNEILTLQWRQIDLDAKTVRLEPGTTKNGEGRTFPFGSFPALEALLKDQREMTEAFQKSTGQIVPGSFIAKGGRSWTIVGHGRRRWKLPTFRSASRTISGEPQYGTWEGLACPAQ